MKNFLYIISGIALLAAAASLSYYLLLYLPHAQALAKVDQEQQRCAGEVRDFLTNNGYDLQSSDPSYSYENHFNTKLNQCFILVSAFSSSRGLFLELSLYDVLQNKHYGDFSGYTICDPLILITTHQDPNQCQANNGSVWLDGNDQFDPDKSFSGVDAQTQFMNAIQPYLND